MSMTSPRTGQPDESSDTHIPADVEKPEDAYIEAAFQRQLTGYQSHHRATYGADTRFEDYEAAYRHGHALAHQPQLRGKSWEEVQPEARRQWEAQQHCSYDPYAGAIREAWEGVNMGL